VTTSVNLVPNSERYTSSHLTPASRRRERLNESMSAPEPNYCTDHYSPWPQLSRAMIVNSRNPGYAVTLCVASTPMNLSPRRRNASN